MHSSIERILRGRLLTLKFQISIPKIVISIGIPRSTYSKLPSRHGDADDVLYIHRVADYNILNIARQVIGITVSGHLDSVGPTNDMTPHLSNCQAYFLCQLRMTYVVLQWRHSRLSSMAIMVI